MNSIDFIKAKQRLWATINNIELIGSEIDRGEKNYTRTLKDNLFSDISPDAKCELSGGSGNELGQGIKPGKINAVHSSSALTLNAFDYWKNNADKAPIAKSLKIPSVDIVDIGFERQFKIFNSDSTPPNIDVVFTYKNGHASAIECKFSEPYNKRKDENHGIKEVYFAENNKWQHIPNLENLAKSISPADNKYTHLHAAQLIKHILGLLNYFNGNKEKFRLIYLWYAANSPECALHEKEIEEFKEIAHKDNIQFQERTWQEVIIYMSENYWVEHSEYLKYLSQRYL